MIILINRVAVEVTTGKQSNISKIIVIWLSLLSNGFRMVLLGRAEIGKKITGWGSAFSWVCCWQWTSVLEIWSIKYKRMKCSHIRYTITLQICLVMEDTLKGGYGYFIFVFYVLEQALLKQGPTLFSRVYSLVKFHQFCKTRKGRLFRTKV